MKTQMTGFVASWTVVASAAMVTTVGCSWGTVRDAQTNAPISGATVTYKKLDISGTPGQMWNQATFTGKTLSTTTWGSAGGILKGMFYLNPYAAQKTGIDFYDLFVNPGWTRVEVNKAGYDKRIHYYDHQYTNDCQTYDKLAFPSGSYPLTDKGDLVQNARCNEREFKLRKSTDNYDVLPDMIVDPRSLHDFAIKNGAANCDGVTSKCLRVSVSTPNVGTGDLHVRAPVANPGNVQQRVYHTTGAHTDKTIAASFSMIGHEDHDHFHIGDWTELRLRKYHWSCPTQGWASCPVVGTGNKVSFCLTDLGVFDPALNSGNSYSCNTVGAWINQGISAGKFDIYTKELYGQLIDLAAVPSGKYWLEVVVNPAQTVIESDYDNNAARILVTIP